MKKIISLISILALGATLFLACNNQEIAPSAPVELTEQSNAINSKTVDENNENEALDMSKVVSQNAIAGVSYTTSPALNVWTASSTIAQATNCAVFQSGLKAKVIAIAGNKITVQIQKANGSTFGRTGTAYMKASSVCGNIAGTSTIQSSFYYANVDFWCSFTSGRVSFSPSITLSNGTRMYAPLITVNALNNDSSLPVSIYQSQTGGLRFGTIYGTVNGVSVISNGPTISSSTRETYNGYDVGYKYQCVNLIRRYFWQKFGKKMGEGFNAKDFFGNAYRWGFTAYSNGGGVAPKAGDVLCVTGTSSNGYYGHVAIISKVTDTYIEVCQQNVLSGAHLNARFAKSGNRISGTGIQGWIRMN